MMLRSRLFSIVRTPYKIVVRFAFLKFFWRSVEFSPSRLRKIPEDQYPELLQKWYSLTLHGEKLDLHNPKTFNHKLQWLKFYGDRRRMTELADKVKVRAFVGKTIGEEYLVPIVGVYDRAENIPWNNLPNRFVLKPNHGSHWIRIVEDKSKLDVNAVANEANAWLEEDYSVYGGFEMQYRDITPKLIVERHLGEVTHDLNDYKVWCFNGKPTYVQVFLDRYSPSGCKTCFYSTSWEKQRFYQNYPFYTGEVPRPRALQEMLLCATKLSSGIPFVRVDFYTLDDGTLRFGEMTFTPSSGACPWEGEDGVDGRLGAMLELPAVVAPLLYTPPQYVNDWIKDHRVPIVHILPDEKFTQCIIDFVNKRFSKDRHAFIISGDSKWPVGIVENVFRTDLLKLKIPNSVGRILFHSLFSRKCISYLRKHISVLKRSIWMVWGADLYRAPRGLDDDFVRKNFLAVAGLDGNEFEDRYGKKSVIECLPVVSADVSKLTTPCKRNEHKRLRVLLNHACHPETVDLIRRLKRFKGCPMEVYAILSYGRMQFKEKIIHVGQAAFGSDFKYITEFLPIEEYKAFVADMDIVIFNINRQAGMGMCNQAVSSGVKVFVEEEASHFSFYERNGIRFLPTSMLEKMSWEDFSRRDEALVKENRDALLRMLNPPNVTSSWSPLFEPYDKAI